MKTKLIELLGISEEKMNLLLLLYDGSKKKEKILELMGISRQALNPHVTLLEENGLITKRGDTYELTGVGKITVCEMISFLETLDFLDNNSGLLGKYNLDFIPQDLLETFHEVGSFRVKEPLLSEIHEPDKEFISTVSNSLSIITTFLYPTFDDIASKLMKKGASISLVINQAMLDKLRKDCDDDFKLFLENERSSVYLYPEEIGFVSFGLTDTCLMLRLLRVKDGFDNRIITADSKNAVEWGRKFFEHYKKRSTQITAI